MRNGEYTLVIAPDDYPGTRYRGRYCYEHHAVWWKKTGSIVPHGHVIHHEDGNKRNNDPANLELMDAREHSSHHARIRPIELRHGAFSAYMRHGCRCAPCSSWGKAYKAELATRRRNARRLPLLAGATIRGAVQ